MFKINKRAMSPWRAAVLDLNDQGVFDKDNLIRDLLNWLSESEVEQFCRANDLPITGEDTEEEEDDETVPL